MLEVEKGDPEGAMMEGLLGTRWLWAEGGKGGEMGWRGKKTLLSLRELGRLCTQAWSRGWKAIEQQWVQRILDGTNTSWHPSLEQVQGLVEGTVLAPASIWAMVIGVLITWTHECCCQQTVHVVMWSWMSFPLFEQLQIILFPSISSTLSAKACCEGSWPVGSVPGLRRTSARWGGW